MQIFEYALHLSTNEHIEIVEISMAALDAWSRQAFEDPAASKAISPVLSLCVKTPKPVVEEAKMGYTKPLERMLKTLPIGALIKLDKPVCASLSDCVMANPKKCTTRPESRKISIPECWDYNIGTVKDFTNAMIAAQEVAKTIVVRGWGLGKYVIISD